MLLQSIGRTYNLRRGTEEVLPSRIAPRLV
jgi:hypothetical protein